MANYKETLEQFIASPDFESGVISSTKASWGGSDYRVELLPDGTWRVLWKNQIGNLYETPGVILVLPQLSTDDMQQYIDDGAGSQEDFLIDAFLCEQGALEFDLRQQLSDKLEMDM